MASSGNEAQVELVNLQIDGKAVKVPKGTNLIEAAKSIGIEIPFYCYHPDLTIAGNCRMCQIRVKGAPKLDIACNTAVKEGMEVFTQESNLSSNEEQRKFGQEVKDAQSATLEFILINHPLDCTVCDQAGHCKLQDYHFDYNAKPSRFLEEKEHKVKAEPLGPTVVLDGERCIMCTRCVRFCDEVTKTSELGMANRGDKSVIVVNPGRELNNPLSGTVVDLCPVGALTHRNWRFNTRIWFTKETDSICPGCSTGCNVKVAERDGEVVQVKARYNDQVNKEWLCDEGRYGFGRFLPKQRITGASIAGVAVTTEEAVLKAKDVLQKGTLVILSPDLLLEEYAIVKKMLALAPEAVVGLAYKERELTDTEAILVSPDYACNFQGAEVTQLIPAGGAGNSYQVALKMLREGRAERVLLVGDRAILREDLDPQIITGIQKAALSVWIGTDAENPLAAASKIVFGGRSILEKAGLLVNRKLRLQYSDRVVGIKEGTDPEWRILRRLSESRGVRVTAAESDRELTIGYLAEGRFPGITIGALKKGGFSLSDLKQAPKGEAPQGKAEGSAAPV